MNTKAAMRIVLAAVGSRGDVQPILAIAQVLAGRGHTPVIAAPPNFADWAKGLGFEFAPLGQDMQVYLAEHGAAMTGNPARMLKTMSRFFAETIPLQMKQLVPVCVGADAILAGGLAFVAPSVAEHLGLPVLFMVYTSGALPSKQHPPMMVPWRSLPGWLNDLLWRADHLFADTMIRGTINSARAQFGLLALKDLRRHISEDTSLVIAADEILFPPDPSWKERHSYANFIFFDDPGQLDPELDAWLSAGEPPVFVGFGSMSGEGTGRVERIIVDAVSATGKRCIVGAGWAGLGAGSLPAGWRVVRDAPHALLFPRNAVVVHHGGSGTTASALRAGVPQVILPLILDQFHHAHCLHLAGLAPRPIPMEKINAGELTASIQAALALPAGPRLAAAERLRASDGRAQIADRILAMIAEAEPHTR